MCIARSHNFLDKKEGWKLFLARLTSRTVLTGNTKRDSFPVCTKGKAFLYSRYAHTMLNNPMTDCIFCKIIAGKIPCYKVYDDKEILAFLDIQPHAQGHTVVIPKKHAETVFDLGEKEMQSLMLAVQKTMIKIDEKLHPDGFNVGWNHNPAGGQVVPHLHIHIMPRYTGDGGGSMHSIIKNPGRKSVEDVAKMFK